MDQPHLQASRLGQVIPDPPVIAGAPGHQPLNALTPEVIHQRDHRPVAGLNAPHPLPLAVRPAPRHPDAHHPGPLGDIDRGRIRHDPGAFLSHLRAVIARLRRRGRRPPAWRRSRFSSLRPSRPRLHREPAGTRLPGGGAGKNRIRSACSKRQYPARVIAPSTRLTIGHEAPGIQRRHRQHAAVMLRSGRAWPPEQHKPSAPRPYQTGHRAHPRPPWNRSRRRPAHGQHTHRRTRRPVTARTGPAIPRFEGTSRRQDQETYKNRRPGGGRRRLIPREAPLVSQPTVAVFVPWASIHGTSCRNAAGAAILPG